MMPRYHWLALYAFLLAAITAGVLALFVLRIGLADALPWVDPTLGGIVAGAVAFALSMAVGARKSAAGGL